MSVTVEDLLKLPSLRRAKVLGGAKGLSRIVSSISVLESVDPGVLIDDLFPKGEFFGSEIVITGFMNILEDVEGQCANMRRMAEGGEAGLILFYVGVYLPYVDQRLVDLADELDFVLICMPEGERSLRYSEVISDVTDCIYRDRMKHESIVTEILERAAALPAQFRSVNMVLQMLSDRTAASLVLCDRDMRILNLAAWPRSLENTLKRGIEECAEFPGDHESRECAFLSGGTWSRFTLNPDRGAVMELFLLKEGASLSETLTGQVLDVVRLGVNIWGQRHSEVAVHELVHAILQDEPMKMRRLADIFHIRVEDIHEMWIICKEEGGPYAFSQEESAFIKACAKNCADTVIADIYEGKILLFLSDPYSLKEAQQQIAGLLERIGSKDGMMTLTRCNGLCNTGEVRNAYLCHQEYLADSRKVFPRHSCFQIGEIEYVKNCRQLIGQGEEDVRRCLDCLRGLRADHENQSLLETLTTYMLDGGASVARTAELLYVHKNTVKYRLQRIADILGYRPDKMPEGIEVYRAAAVYRLLG